MDEAEKLIRERLQQANARLEKIEAERALWLSIRDGDRLLLNQITGLSAQSELNLRDGTEVGITIKSTKWPGAIKELLRASGGRVLTTHQIYETLKAAGLKTNSQDPIGQVDWNLAKLIRERTAPIERVSTQHYRWREVE